MHIQITHPTYFRKEELKSGDKLVARKQIQGHVVRGQLLPSGHAVLGFTAGRIDQGEHVTFLKHDYGAGSDPAFVVSLEKQNGVVVEVQVGWFHLRRDEFIKEHEWPTVTVS